MKWPITLALVVGWPTGAQAHAPAPGSSARGLDAWVGIDPWVLFGVSLPMLLAALVYARGTWLSGARAEWRAGWRAASFAGGMITLFLALIWPLDPLTGRSFAAHMGQHMLLMVVAPPLLLLGRPLPILVRGWRALAHLSRWARRGCWQVLARPDVAFVLHGFAIWGWHIPQPYALAVQIGWVHMLEHLSFLGTGLLFWWGVIHAGSRRGIGYGAAGLLVLGTLMHTGLLGAILTFAPRPLYAVYATKDALAGGLSPLADQQLAGLLMWVPGGFAYLVAGVVLAGVWLRAAECATGVPKRALRI